MLNMIFGILPFFAAILMTQMKEDSHPARLWLSIVKHFYSFESNDLGAQPLTPDATWFWKCSRFTDDVQ
jgi:hypothetical protein